MPVFFSYLLSQLTSTKWSSRSLLAGSHPFRLRDELEQSPTLAEIMRENCYATVGFSAGGYVSPKWGTDRILEAQLRALGYLD